MNDDQQPKVAAYSGATYANVSPVTWGVQIEREWKACPCSHVYDEHGDPHCYSQQIANSQASEIARLDREAAEYAASARTWLGLALAGWAGVGILLLGTFWR